jgi:hypothetical protein
MAPLAPPHLAVLSVHVGLVIQQGPDHLTVAMVCCVVKGRLAGLGAWERQISNITVNKIDSIQCTRHNSAMCLAMMCTSNFLVCLCPGKHQGSPH